MPYNIPLWATGNPADLTGPLAKSYQKALDSDVTPLTLDRDNGIAEFEGRHGHYTASLDGCPCGSHPKPCKHMFRIAIELQLMPGTPASDYEKVL